jgi:hypothetical protein
MRLVSIIGSLSSEETFAEQLVLRDLFQSAGEHTLEFYAIDDAGTISRTPVLYSFTLSASTVSPVKTPPPTAIATPQLTPLADIHHSHQDIEIYDGVWSVFLAISSPTSSSYLQVSPIHFGSQPLGGRRFATSIACRTVASTVIIGIEFLSFLDVDQSAELFAWDSHLFYENDVELLNSPRGTGFSAHRNLVKEQFFCKNHPLVTDVDGYWFGLLDYSETNFYSQVEVDALRTYNYDAAMTMRWSSISIPARGRAFRSLVVGLGPESSPPSLDMAATSFPSVLLAKDTLTLTGTVSDSDGDTISIFSVVNGAVARMTPIQFDLSPGAFTVTVSAESVGLVRGANFLQFYAIDSTGTIGRNPANFSVTLNAPTDTPTASPTPTETASRSSTPTKTPLGSRTADPSLSPGPSPTVSRSPRESRTPRATVTPQISGTPQQSPTVTRSPSPTIRPIPVVVSGDTAISDFLITPIVVNGSGTIRSEVDNLLRIRTLTVDQGSQITAYGLSIQKSLVLLGNSVLSAGENDQIAFLPVVDITLQSDGAGGLPTLDLGLLGDEFNSVPESLAITGLAALDPAAVGARKLISGRTLGNCEEWKDLVVLDSTAFATECRTTASAARVLADDALPEVALFLVMSPAHVVSATPAPTESSDSNTGVIVGVVVGVVVVIGVVVVLVFVVLKKGDGHSLESSGAAGPKEAI